MSDIWQTKYGRRRVRRDLPTLEEAILAARGLSDELQEQVEIAAALIAMPHEKVMAAAVRMTQRKDVNRVAFTTTRGGTHRAVVVERRPSRRPLQRELFSR